MARIAVLLCSIAVSAAASGVLAAYPDHPIRLVVPYPPGGNIDITARTVAPGLGEGLGASIVVDNRGGAGGTIGSELVAKAPPDGYTMLMASTGTLATAKALYPRLTFDPLKDFAYTSLVSRVALVAICNPAFPPKTVKELVALAKSKPGKITYGSAGTGTSNHLTGELFQTVTGTKLLHVPFKGSGPALIDLMGGQIDMMFDQVSSSVGYIQGGKLRAIAVTTLKRTSALPTVPTMDESGLKGFEASTTTGIALPGATSKDVINRVSGVLHKVLRQAATRDAFTKLGADVVESTPEEFDKLMKGENVKWTKVIHEGNVKVE